MDERGAVLRLGADRADMATMSGYEKSPSYGDPPHGWLYTVLAIVLMAAAAAGYTWLMMYA